MPTPLVPADRLEMLTAQAEHQGAVRELDALRQALRNAGSKDATLQRRVEMAEDRIAKLAARLADLRVGRAPPGP